MKTISLLILGFCTAVAGIAAPAFAQPRFEILDLLELDPAAPGVPYSINDRGVIVGISYLEGHDWPSATAWVDGEAYALGIVEGDDLSEAVAVNLHGAAVGNSTWLEEIGHIIRFYPTAVLFEGGEITEIESLVQSGQNWELLYGIAINDAGKIIGTGRDRDTENPISFLFEDGVLTELGTLGGYATQPAAINNSRLVVGQSWTSGGQDHAFVWEDGVMTDLGTLGGRDSNAYDVNEEGWIAGWAQSPTSPTIAVVWIDGVMNVLGTLGGNQSHASALNDRGQIVGFSTDENHHSHMFFWEEGVMINPMEHLASNDGWGGRASATDINGAGQIVGTAYRNGYDAPAVLTPVDLELSPLEPGIAGQVNTIDITGVTPGRRVFLAFGGSAGMKRIPGCAGATVLISNPKVAGTFTADEQGAVHVEREIPPRFAGRSVVLQAIQRSDCKVSNLTRVTLE